MKNGDQPKVLVLLPANYSLHEIIAYNLEKLGYDALVINNESFPFQYKNLGEKLKNFWVKTFQGDKSFKQRLRDERFLSSVKNFVNVNAYYDHILVIRADFFSLELIDFLRTKTKDFVSYHFDGLNRYPKAFEFIEKFDRFYVFDKKDIELNPSFKLLPATNFYFNYHPNNNGTEDKNLDFYFLCSYHESRNKPLLDFAAYAQQHNYTYDFEVIYASTNPPTSVIKKQLNCHTGYISFTDYLQKIKKSKYILDLLISEHLGLSFRVFESLQLKKKLITTNSTVKQYDFYHPNNIFVLDNNYEALEEFLKLPYHELEQEIVEKYSMENWLKYIFKTDPYSPISLP